ncbi:MAG: hypothetical protein GAK30_00730 [Paracidovorax wautersii]|uniref:Lipoprotein n=1 Tax=Paracidovorax wautersii TaxID=1177982 RepID=A0A7V8FRE3_9BURK|nr:MAG: hypothetical protein GAK30_00730 [Paracidovorax wautersii]
MKTDARAVSSWGAAMLVALALMGCASAPAVPAAQPAAACARQLLGQPSDARQADAASVQARLLVIQCEGQALRFVMTDPLGVPLARQVLAQGRWQADGLLPPAPAARTLFAAVLFGLAVREPLDVRATTSLAALYPGLEVRRAGPSAVSLWREGQWLWTATRLGTASGWRLDFPQPVDGASAWSWQPLPGDAGEDCS